MQTSLLSCLFLDIMESHSLIFFAVCDAALPSDPPSLETSSLSLHPTNSHKSLPDSIPTNVETLLLLHYFRSPHCYQ